MKENHKLNLAVEYVNEMRKRTKLIGNRYWDVVQMILVELIREVEAIVQDEDPPQPIAPRNAPICTTCGVKIPRIPGGDPLCMECVRKDLF